MKPWTCALIVVFALAGGAFDERASADPLSLAPPPSQAKLEQRLDAQLPLDLTLVDSDGQALPLRRLFGQRPVLLVFGYYRCPQLCGLLMQGLFEGLKQSGLRHADYRIVRVSIDPSDDAQSATARRKADLSISRQLDGTDAPADPPDLHLLTGREPELRRLTEAAGLRYAPGDVTDDPAARFQHPAAVIVVTPAGRISSYQMGVRFDPTDLRLAVLDADHERIGSLSDRIALLCAHLDLRLGRHSASVMWGLRAMALLLVASLAALFWRSQRSPSSGAPR
jgi:protein SCO1/2